jgi:hypothetical protein
LSVMKHYEIKFWRRNLMVFSPCGKYKV